MGFDGVMADRFKVQRQKSVDEIVVENRGAFKVISREAAQSLVEIINAYFGTEGEDEKGRDSDVVADLGFRGRLHAAVTSSAGRGNNARGASGKQRVADFIGGNMSQPNRKCDICLSSSWDESELKNINIFVHGSEGAWICPDCDHAITNYMSSMRAIAGRATREVYRVQATRSEK